MARKSALAIGLDPAFVDLSAFPQFTPELVRSYLEAQIAGLRALGYDAESCLTDLGETAEAVATAALTVRHYDCVVIGAGLSLPPRRLALFEAVVNTIRRAAPKAAIAFNTRPEDTGAAAARWI